MYAPVKLKDNMHQTTACHVCGCTSSFFMEKDECSLFRCGTCGLVFVFPPPSAEEVARIYSPESRYQAYKAKDLSCVQESEKTKNILDRMEAHLLRRRGSSPRKHAGRRGTIARILDVGCSNGEFLYHAKRRGFDTYGVELNKKTADIARANGLFVHCGALEEARFYSDFFDFVLLGDIIEHVPDPRALLLECRRVLKKKGMIVVVTPNSSCFWADATLVLYRAFGIPWAAAEPPHHLYQFSYENAGRLLCETGFRECEFSFRPPPPLKYELGALHLRKRYKKTRAFSDLAFMLFAYSVYAALYGANILAAPFKKKDFTMTACCTR